MAQIEIPTFATFFVRDGKAARDLGNLTEMQRQITKVRIDHRLTQEQKDLCVDKILHAAYRPDPLKPASGCVVPGRLRTYTVSKVSDPLALAQARIEEMHKAGDLSDDEADQRLAKIAEKVEARNAEAAAARKAQALAEIDALLA